MARKDGLRLVTPPGGGWPSLYPGKGAQPVAIKLTPEGARLLRTHAKRTRLSRSDFIEALLRTQAATLNTATLA